MRAMLHTYTNGNPSECTEPCNTTQRYECNRHISRRTIEGTKLKAHLVRNNTGSRNEEVKVAQS